MAGLQVLSDSRTIARDLYRMIEGAEAALMGLVRQVIAENEGSLNTQPDIGNMTGAYFDFWTYLKELGCKHNSDLMIQLRQAQLKRDGLRDSYDELPEIRMLRQMVYY